MEQIITTSDISDYDNEIFVISRTAYEYSVIELAEVYIYGEPKTVMCYKILVGDDQVHVHVDECVEVKDLPKDFNYTHLDDAIEERFLDKTPDAVGEYAEAFGITKEMFYLPNFDGVLLEDSYEHPKTDETEKAKDLSNLPFIY